MDRLFSFALISLLLVAPALVAQNAATFTCAATSKSAIPLTEKCN